VIGKLVDGKGRIARKLRISVTANQLPFVKEMWRKGPRAMNAIGG
jgi:hypothetical protein